LAQRVATFSSLLGAFLDGVNVPVEAPRLGPAQMIEDIIGIIDLLMSANATYTRSIEVGEGITLPSGLGAALVGANAEITATINADRALSYTEATGVVRNGHIYELARYARNLFPTFGDASDDFVELAGLGFSAMAAHGAAALDYVVGNPTGNGTTTIRSNRTAQLEFSGAGEPSFIPVIASWVWEPGTTETGFRIQRPGDYRGPVDVGHYGVGGFHQFLPANKVFQNPATLTFFYRDDEIGPIDESQLSIYRWNETTEDWEFLGGTPNPAANTVTVTVDRMGLYTMAPPIPAGTIALSATWTGGGTEQNPTTTETYTSEPLRLNTGAPVPDGTLYTVSGADPSDTFVAYGTVENADADPSTPGTQVASAGGRISFTVTYPAAAGGVRPLAFSKVGTALAVAFRQLRQ
jgi:hypothetical protein